MLENFIISRITAALPFVPNEGQKTVIESFARFLLSGESRRAFILRGYAGTGKTSIVAALVKAMEQMQQHCTLLAPTGRAAKVMSRYAMHPAYTVHKCIYHPHQTEDVNNGGFSLGHNTAVNTLFVVDEASMLSYRLLTDLLTFVFSTPDSKNSLLLLGDEAQLPPVGQDFSPALKAEYLRSYNIDVTEQTLTEVARQALDSGILSNATRIRQGGSMTLTEAEDVKLLLPNRFQETIEQAYNTDGIAETIVLTRSNRRANLYNQGIRAQILWREEQIAAGDRLMVCRNNYFWTEQYDNLPFIANGDTLEVERLSNEREMYGFHFIDAALRSLDYDWAIDATLWLDTLFTPSPDDNNAMLQQLYDRVGEDYADERNAEKRDKLIRQSPYFNALQVRFAYAVTCHKAQGGQWDNVFIDEGVQIEGMSDTEQRRWLYTALTRAKKRLWKVGSL